MRSSSHHESIEATAATLGGLDDSSVCTGSKTMCSMLSGWAVDAGSEYGM